MIYFIHDETGRAIKIGFAWNPEERLAALQTSNPNKLVLLGSIAGMKKAEKEVHALVCRHCGKLPGERSIWVSGEWFDDRILPFVRELIASPATFMPPKPKKPPRPRPADGDLRDCSIVLVFDTGETFREAFALRAASTELALTALESITTARLCFLAHTARVTQLRVPGCPTKKVDLRGAFTTQGCNPREGLSVIFNSLAGNSYGTHGGKLYSDQWLHGVPSEFYSDETRWWLLGRVYTRVTTQFVTLLEQFARMLNQNKCVIAARNPLDLRGLLPRGIGLLPKGKLRSKTNRKAASKRRRTPVGDSQPKSGRVYFIQDKATGAIKIGFCQKNPEKRLADLQTGNANPLKLMGHVAGSEAHEKLLHRRFSTCRIHREWFSTNILGKVREILECTSLEEWLKVAVTAASPPAPASA